MLRKTASITCILTESLNITSDRTELLCLDFEGELPMMRIPNHLDKGNKTRLRPITPQFFQLLQQIPPHHRTGYVFQPLGKSTTTTQRYRVMKTAVRIDRASGFVVKEATEKQREKFVTLHDIRRTFAERISRKLRLDEVQELMGHASIETTKRYYVGSNAERTGRRLWEAFRGQ